MVKENLRELALFAGAGGGLLGSTLLGWRTVCAVEIDAYCRRVLLSRQKDGFLPLFPIWDDINTFDGKPWKGHIDIISGGFPCQDISRAGSGKGLGGERSSLWFEMFRVIKEVSPSYVFIENTPEIRKRGLNKIIFNLSTAGFNVRWGVYGGCHVGAPSKGLRLWIFATTDCEICTSWMGFHKTNIREKEQKVLPENNAERLAIKWWSMEPPRGGCRVDDGMANRVDRMRALGNGQVPGVAALAWNDLIKR